MNNLLFKHPASIDDSRYWEVHIVDENGRDDYHHASVAQETYVRYDSNNWYTAFGNKPLDNIHALLLETYLREHLNG